jgi:hypothetical protein
MQTSKKRILPATGEKLTLFQEVFPANPTPLQESDLEKKMTATSGRKCLDAFGRLSRAGPWGKTFSELLIGMEGWYSTKCRLTWKLKGTKYKRMYFQLAVSTPRTEEIGSGLLPMLPTPQAIDGNGQGRDLRLKKDCNRDPDQSGSWRGDLKDFAAKGMLPTPKTQDSRHALSDRGKSNLGEEISQWGQDNGIGSQLNPPFVAEMMGFPPDWTELPFLNGETKASKPTETP